MLFVDPLRMQFRGVQVPIKKAWNFEVFLLLTKRSRLVTVDV